MRDRLTCSRLKLGLLSGLLVVFVTPACGKQPPSGPTGNTSPTRPEGSGGETASPDADEPSRVDADDVTVDGGGQGTSGPPSVDARPADPLNLRACMLLQAGAVVPVVGGSVFSLGAPAIGDEAKVYRISIAKRQTAHVSFTAPAAGVYVIYTSTKAPLAAFALDGELIEISKLSTSIPECPEVKGRHTLTLKMDRMIIRLGPEPAGAVDVLIAPGS